MKNQKTMRLLPVVLKTALIVVTVATAQAPYVKGSFIIKSKITQGSPPE